MFSSTLSLVVIICGSVLFVIDILIFLLCFRWWKRTQKEKKRKKNRSAYVPLIRTIASPSTTSVTAQPDIRKLKPIPKLTSVTESAAIPAKTVFESGVEPIVQHVQSEHVTLKKTPRIGFQLYYDYRNTQLRVKLVALKNIHKLTNEQQVAVTILMSHTKTLYQSSKVDGPDAVFNEEYSFPLDSLEISSDPPIITKFNVCHVDIHGRKTPFGFVEIKVEDTLADMNNITSRQGKTIWRNVILSDFLINEGLMKGELLITLSYLYEAQRINCTIVKARDLNLTAKDKDLHVKITLLCRDEEQQSVVTNYTEITQNPEFNREFIFRFDNLRHASLDGMALRIDVIAREGGLSSSHRTLGRCMIGNSNLVDRPGREHWATCLTSPKSISQWHQLRDPGHV